jgi:hypothetical protein
VLPDYWLPRPRLDLDTPTRYAVEEFVSRLHENVAGRILEVDPGELEVTLWKFLCGVAERVQIAFHGTGDPDIESFEPREPIDFAPFGQQKAVFATSDPIWAMFYAIVDRDRYPITLNNGCILLLDPEGRPSAPYYYFSITQSKLPQQPWRTGTSISYRQRASSRSRPGRMVATRRACLSWRARWQSHHSRACGSLPTISRSSDRFAAMTTSGSPTTRRQ